MVRVSQYKHINHIKLLHERISYCMQYEYKQNHALLVLNTLTITTFRNNIMESDYKGFDNQYYIPILIYLYHWYKIVQYNTYYVTAFKNPTLLWNVQ